MSRESNRWSRASSVFLAISIFFASFGTARAQVDPNCQPANLMMVVDTSGSMSQAGKLDGLKKAIKDVVAQFKNKLRLGLISFSSSQARLLVQIGPDNMKDRAAVEAHAKKIIAAVDKLQAKGDTPMTQAMRLARDNYKKIIPKDPLHLDPDPKTKRRHFVLLCTDGEPTDGNPLPIIKELRNLRIGPKTYDILTFVVGLGSKNDIRSAQLQDFAKAGGTEYFLHALKPEDLAPFFKQISNKASREVCNGRDDDCDGLIDEDVYRNCKSACGEGKQKCHRGKWGPCDAPQPQKEVCDGRDNDCDGQIDEGITVPCRTPCGTGTQSCIQGDWSTCNAPAPQAEICDGKDNDCDGQIDEGTLCPGGGKCKPIGKGAAACEIKCQNNECPPNYTCNFKTQLCEEGPCVKKDCPVGEVCTEENGKAVCKNLCKGVTCPPGKTCGLRGKCVDCYRSPCPPKMVCRDGRCVPDPCLNVSCGEDQYCQNGKCVKSCVGVKCPPGNICQKGLCVRDPCADVKCKPSQICVEGRCVANRCVDKNTPDCGPNQICDPTTGTCQDDPCLFTKCPDGVECFRGVCGAKPSTFQCKTAKDCPGAGWSCKNSFCYQIAEATAASGCGCSQTPGLFANILALLLLSLFLFSLKYSRPS